MKKIMSMLLSLLLIQPVYAEFAKLKLNISGVSSNKYFLCVSNVGCVNIKTGNHGTIFPMNTGKIGYIMPVSSANLYLHPHTLPKSCNIDVKEKQTITIKGHLSVGTNGQISIVGLNCKSSG